MAIIRFDFKPSEIPADAVNVQASHRQAGYSTYRRNEETGQYEYLECPGPCGLWTWDTHVGLCLSDFERNGYDDSDFIMVVWNPEKGAPEQICFASTRGWSYPSYGSKPDATPEVRAAYDAWCAHRQRTHDVQRRRAASKRRAELARKVGVRPSAIRRLEEAHTRDEFARLAKLVEQHDSKRIKEFRRSLAAQVVAWLRDPAPRYPRPLSPKQMQWA